MRSIISKIIFSVRSSFNEIRYSIFLIIGLSIALSMITGTSYFINAYQKEAFNQYITNFEDFSIKTQYDATNVWNETENNIDQNRYAQILDNNNFQFEFLEKYYYFEPSSRYFTNEFIPINCFVSTFSFYQSERFQKNINIISGSLPMKNNEIIIEAKTAEFYNYSVYDNFEYIFDASLLETTSSLNFIFSLNYTISGIYNISFPYMSLFYDDYGGKYDNHLIFLVKPENSSIDPQFFNMYNNFQTYCIEEEKEYSNVIRVDTGFLGFINRNTIPLDSLIKYSNSLDLIEDRINYEFPTYERIQIPLKYQISNFISQMRIFRIELFTINIPIHGVSLIFGIILSKINSKKRMNEYALYDTKGISNKMLVFLFFTDAIIFSVISTILSAGGGILIFDSLSSIFFHLLNYERISIIHLNFKFSLKFLLDSLITSLIILFIANWSSFRSIKTKIQNTISNEYDFNQDIQFDERVLLKNMRELDDLKMEGSNLEKFQDKSLRDQLVQSESSKLLDKNWTSLNKITENQNKTKNKGILAIFISFIPIILFILMKFGEMNNSLDLLVYFSDFLKENIDLLMILSLISPIFFPWGFFNLIIIKRPIWFSKIITFLTLAKKKRKNYLISLKILNQKKNRTLIILVSLFFSSFIYTNLLANSLNIHYNLINNFAIGTDFNGKLFKTQLNDTELNQTVELYQNSTRDTVITSVLDNDDILIDMTTCIMEPTIQEENYEISTFFVDFFKYFSFIKSNGKIIPSKNFGEEMQKIIDYSNDFSNEVPGVVVTEDFIEYTGKKIGDLENITHFRYDSESQILIETFITVKIISVVSFFPGIYFFQKDTQMYYGGIMADISLIKNITIDRLPDNIGIFHLYNIIDSSQLTESNLDSIQNSINNIVNYRNLLLYNYQIKEQSSQNLPILLQIYEIFYFDSLIIGGMISFGVISIILTLQGDYRYNFGIFLSHGLGQDEIHKMTLFEIFIILTIASLIGIFSGLLFGISHLNIYQSSSIFYYGVSLPIYSNIVHILMMFSAIFFLSFTIYYISYFLTRKKKIQTYFHKF